MRDTDGTMTRKLLVAASILLGSFGCTEGSDQGTPQEDASMTSPFDMTMADMTAPDDQGVSVDMFEAVDAGEDLDVSADLGSDAGADEEMGRDLDMDADMQTAADAGPDEPCPGGQCSPQDCAANGWLPPGNLQRDTMPLLRDDTVALDWEQFYGQPFPRGNARKLEVEPDHYVAIELDTNTFRGEGSIVFDNPQAAGPWGSRLISISQCPGYLGPSPYPGDPECREWKFAVGNIDFTVAAGSDTRDCDLEPDRTYYLNIVFVDEVLPEGSEDLTWRCALGELEDETWETCGALMESTYVDR